jgi:ubiquinone/menaquinone biosynthesis C-methylase UbiE
LTDPKRIVASGYDAIADRYNEWAESFETPEHAWLRKLLARIKPGGEVLDLGCGGGRAAARAVARAHGYIGVDLSHVQLERARRRVPEGRFVLADAATVRFEAASFDAVMSLFMFGHIPRVEQMPLLRRIYGWLRPGGWFLTTLGIGDADDVVEEDWLGAPMYFGSFDEKTNLRHVVSAGFEVEDARVVPFEEPGHGVASFMWVLARRPP